MSKAYRTVVTDAAGNPAIVTSGGALTVTGAYGAATQPFNLQVARGLVPGYKFNFKFGFNSSLGTTEETVWTESTIYSYPPSAIQMTVSSSSILDDAVNVGARTVVISGLDQNYNEASETIIMDGQNPVLTVNTYIRMNRAYVLTADGLNTAAGNIYVGSGSVVLGVPAIIYAVITLGENQTLMALWTVPAGYTGYLMEAVLNSGDNSTVQYTTARLVQRQFGGVFRTVSKLSLHDGQGSFDGSTIPLSFPEKTDLEIRAYVSAGTHVVGANFAILYILNTAA